MTKKELIDLWNSLDDDTEIVFSHAYSKEDDKIKKFIIIAE